MKENTLKANVYSARNINTLSEKRHFPVAVVLLYCDKFADIYFGSFEFESYENNRSLRKPL